MSETPHRRRARYRGTHPRRFDERYKELSPERYSETAEKVRASGRTPAGSHRPVLVAEILEVLAPKPGEIAIDATLGWGGHAAELLPHLIPGGKLFGLDVDPIERPKTEARLRALGFDENVLVVRATNFAGLPKLLAAEGLAGGVDLILADLGVSSMQIDDPARGFTFKHEGPLDLRMNPGRGSSAADLLATISEVRLVRLLGQNSDEPWADRIAREVVRRREASPIRTTTELSQAVSAALDGLPVRDLAEAGDRPFARVFQALRMEVNDEMPALDRFLASLPAALRPGGRVAILTFHSGEDRRVKKSFAAGRKNGTWSAIADEVIRPGPAERNSNPRSSPAKLRWAIRAADIPRPAATPWEARAKGGL